MLAEITTLPVLQWVLLGLSCGAFLAAFGWALPLMRGNAAPGQGAQGAEKVAGRWLLVRGSIGLGVAAAVALLAWRASNTRALPLYNYLDAFLVLALLLTGVLIYFRLTHYLRGLALFLLPMIAGVLLLGGVLAALNRAEFHDAAAWTLVHLIAVLLGTVCFAAGCVCGAVYLLVDRQLHRAGLDPTHRWSGLPPLARMERFMQGTTFLGFPLLTVAIVAGILRALQQPALIDGYWRSPKLILAAAAWLIYGLLLHVKLTPSFRGPRAAWLSIIGFALLMAVFLVVNRMVKGG